MQSCLRDFCQRTDLISWPNVLHVKEAKHVSHNPLFTTLSKLIINVVSYHIFLVSLCIVYRTCRADWNCERKWSWDVRLAELKKTSSVLKENYRWTLAFNNIRFFLLFLDLTPFLLNFLLSWLLWFFNQPRAPPIRSRCWIFCRFLFEIFFQPGSEVILLASFLLCWLCFNRSKWSGFGFQWFGFLFFSIRDGWRTAVYFIIRGSSSLL